MSDPDRRPGGRGGDHPTERTLTRFLRGELSRSEGASVVRHLLTRCPRCVEIVAGLWRLGDPAPAEGEGLKAEGAPFCLEEVHVDG